MQAQATELKRRVADRDAKAQEALSDVINHKIVVSAELYSSVTRLPPFPLLPSPSQLRSWYSWTSWINEPTHHIHRLSTPDQLIGSINLILNRAPDLQRSDGWPNTPLAFQDPLLHPVSRGPLQQPQHILDCELWHKRDMR